MIWNSKNLINAKPLTYVQFISCKKLRFVVCIHSRKCGHSGQTFLLINNNFKPIRRIDIHRWRQYYIGGHPSLMFWLVKLFKKTSSASFSSRHNFLSNRHVEGDRRLQSFSWICSSVAEMVEHLITWPKLLRRYFATVTCKEIVSYLWTSSYAQLRYLDRRMVISKIISKCNQRELYLKGSLAFYLYL